MFYAVKLWYRASVDERARYVPEAKDLDHVFRPTYSMEGDKTKTVPVHTIRLYGE